MKKSDKFFGWYFKLQKDDLIVAFIVSMHRTKNSKYAMLQVVTDDGDYSFKFDEFNELKPMGLKIGASEFNCGGIKVDIDGENKISADVDFGKFTPIKGDIMRPFKILPRMECRHGIVSMKHKISGNVTINGKKMNFDDGVGYIECDSGRSFPSDYCWTHGMDGDISVMAAVARIPYLGLRFRGVICNVLYDGKQYRLATYNGAKAKVDGDTVRIKKGKYVLLVTATNRVNHALAAPDDGDMTRTIHESPSCPVRYLFTYKGETIFDRVCAAGFETDSVATEKK